MTEITYDLVRELLEYDKNTGELTWRRRELKWFSSGERQKNAQAIWNSRFAEKPAFASVNSCGYRQGKIFGKKLSAHRVIWLWVTGSWPDDEVDHINHRRDDNRFINLRSVSHRENTRNCSKRRNCTSGITGVFWAGGRKPWGARIGVGGRLRTLGQFVTRAEAIAARRAAEFKYGFHPNHGRAAI